VNIPEEKYVAGENKVKVGGVELALLNGELAADG